MSLSYCGPYKVAGQLITKRVKAPPKCERCGKDNYEGGRNCKLCRVARLAEHKARGVKARTEKSEMS
jgi:hypothetical protein